MGNESALNSAGVENQDWSADVYARNARFVADYGEDVLGWLAPQPGERILDLGCGDGALTEKVSMSGAEVVAVDASADMVSAACRRGLDARVVAGEQLAFEQEFDAVFSNAALHWMPDAVAVAGGIARALKPGGRFVAELGGHGNVAAVATALRAAADRFEGDAALAVPWYFPTAEEYAQVLSDAGLSVQRIALIPRPTPLPTGIEGWLQTFSAPFFTAVDADRRAEMLRYVLDLLAPSLADSRGNWVADYVRLRVAATRES